MLYKIFKFLFYYTTKAYFRTLYVENKNIVPEKGPVVFVVNHTSAFMDPILLGTIIKRELFFLSRGDAFKSAFAKWLFPKLHMIPVYRPDLFPNDTHKNKEVFTTCFEHLENGRTIMIFPEGISKTEKRLRPIKTGVSRIALGAEARNNFDLGTIIIPIGINYSNPHHFKSDVFVKFGAPISIKNYKDAYELQKKETVLQLTDTIKSKLEALTIVIENNSLEKVIQQIEILYRSKLRETHSIQEKAPADFYLSKDIVDAVTYFKEKHPERLGALEEDLTAYLNNLKRLGIRDTQIRNDNLSLNKFSEYLFFILGFPLFVFGFMGNFIPFKIAEILAKKILVRADFIGSMKLGLGMFIFLICYSIEFVLLANYTTYFWAFLIVANLYPFGLFTINYIKNYYLVRGTLKYLYLIRRKPKLIQDLKNIRATIVEILEKSKIEYLASKKN